MELVKKTAPAVGVAVKSTGVMTVGQMIVAVVTDQARLSVQAAKAQANSIIKQTESVNRRYDVIVNTETMGGCDI